MFNDGGFPRELRPFERELLSWVLPEDRPGYKEYRELVLSWKVGAQGRRGEGNYILVSEGERADNDSPLPQVFAYGVVAITDGRIAVTIRERLGNQIEYEIVNLNNAGIPEHFKVVKRWTFSTWLPLMPCPMCSGGVREVRMRTQRGRDLVLAVCARDGRLWVYDGATGINHPIPVTNMYNQLVLHKKIRDPKVAFDSHRLFSDLAAFSDRDLTRAFAEYNTIRTKIQLEDRIEIEESKKPSLFKRIFMKAKS